MPLFENCITRCLEKSLTGLSCYAFVWAFVCYFSMYGFRKPFSVETYAGLKLWGVDYKIMLITLQVVGYTISKFIGIKFISELKMNKRGYWILLYIGIAELALILFGAVPPPYNAFFMFINGLPLGMIWGLVFSYLEGRKTSEVLGSGMAVSFIVSSGVVKSVGQVLLDLGVSGFWMPAAVGGIFTIPLILSVYFLECLPDPSDEDIACRTVRVPMTGHDRVVFFKKFAPGIIFMTLLYMCLAAFRDFRDNFAKELWTAFGYAKSPSIFSTSEIIVAVCVVIPIGIFMAIKENIYTLYSYFALMIFGMVLVLVCTISFHLQLMEGLYFMIITGVGLYFCYIPFNSIIFDLIIATFKDAGNSGFLMYICDSLGYSASVVTLFVKQFGAPNINWLTFYIYLSYGMSIIGISMNVFSALYFFFKYRKFNKDNVEENNDDVDEKIDEKEKELEKFDEEIDEAKDSPETSERAVEEL